MSESTTDSLSSSILPPADDLSGKSGPVGRLVVGGDPSILANLATVLAKRGFDVESFHDDAALHDRTLRGATLQEETLQGETLQGETLPRETPPDGRPAGSAPELPRRPAVERIACGKLLIDLAQRRTWWNNVEVTLTTGEFRIVVLLASHADYCIDYRTIYDCLHYKGFHSGYGETGFWVNVRGVIRRIRSQFRAIDGGFEEIQSIRAFGYRWRQPA